MNTADLKTKPIKLRKNFLTLVAIYNARMSEIEKKYFTNSSFHKFTSDIFELVNKSNISNFAKLSALNTKIATLATKAELKSKQNEIVKLETHDLSYFLDKTFVVNNSSPNMFVYQLTINGL